MSIYSKMKRQMILEGVFPLAIELRSECGSIDVSIDVIATIAGGTAIDCHGVIGMISQRYLKDSITELLKKDNFSKGVIVKRIEDKIIIDMYIMVSYGMKISEIAYNVQHKVQYSLGQILGIEVATVNIFVQGMSLMTVD